RGKADSFWGEVDEVLPAGSRIGLEGFREIEPAVRTLEAVLAFLDVYVGHYETAPAHMNSDTRVRVLEPGSNLLDVLRAHRVQVAVFRQGDFATVFGQLPRKDLKPKSLN